MQYHVVPYCNISPNKIVTYDFIDGYKKKKKKLPELVPPPPPHTPDSGGLRLEGYSDTMSHADILDWLSTPVSYVNENSLSNLLLNHDVKNGVLSIPAKKRVRSAINWLYVLSDVKTVKIPDTGKTIRFRLSMITLTLSAKQMHRDNFIKSELLNKFLEKMRYHTGMKAYLWRAERQENGNIHFHITTNVYCHHSDIRRFWNDIQKKYGYIQAFIDNGGHDNPNSTDVHSIYKIKNLAGYLCKYMTKDSDAEPIEGRQWFLSKALSEIKPINEVYGGSLRYEIEAFTATKKMVNYDFAQVFFADIFTSNLDAFPELHRLKKYALDIYKPKVN